MSDKDLIQLECIPRSVNDLSLTKEKLVISTI